MVNDSVLAPPPYLSSATSSLQAAREGSLPEVSQVRLIASEPLGASYPELKQGPLRLWKIPDLFSLHSSGGFSVCYCGLD